MTRSWQRGERGRGELAAVAHALQAGPDGCFPAAAPCRDVVPGHVVKLGEPAARRSGRAASLAARSGVTRRAAGSARVAPGGLPQLEPAAGKGMHEAARVAGQGLASHIH